MNLNLPSYEHKLKIVENKKYIFDQFRKKYIVLTPEEWVRQHFAHYLVNHKGFPASLIALEYGIKLNGMNQRSDIVLFNQMGKPTLIVECKAPEISLTQNVFDQIARYNMQLNVKYLVVTNGLKHYCCQIDAERNTYQFLDSVPHYSTNGQD